MQGTICRGGDTPTAEYRIGFRVSEYRVETGLYITFDSEPVASRADTSKEGTYIAETP